MIKMFFTVIVAMLFAATGTAQNAKLLPNGDYEAITRTTAKDTVLNSTGHVLHEKGVDYPVYVSAKGKRFTVRISKKSGNSYRKYVDTEGKAGMVGKVN